MFSDVIEWGRVTGVGLGELHNADGWQRASRESLEHLSVFHSSGKVREVQHRRRRRRRHFCRGRKLMVALRFFNYAFGEFFFYLLSQSIGALSVVTLKTKNFCCFQRFRFCGDDEVPDWILVAINEISRLVSAP